VKGEVYRNDRLLPKSIKHGEAGPNIRKSETCDSRRIEMINDRLNQKERWSKGRTAVGPDLEINDTMVLDDK
jgi:hypothetical protein